MLEALVDGAVGVESHHAVQTVVVADLLWRRLLSDVIRHRAAHLAWRLGWRLLFRWGIGRLPGKALFLGLGLGRLLLLAKTRDRLLGGLPLLRRGCLSVVVGLDWVLFAFENHEFVFPSRVEFLVEAARLACRGLLAGGRSLVVDLLGRLLQLGSRSFLERLSSCLQLLGALVVFFGEGSCGRRLLERLVGAILALRLLKLNGRCEHRVRRHHAQVRVLHQPDSNHLAHWLGAVLPGGLAITTLNGLQGAHERAVVVADLGHFLVDVESLDALRGVLAAHNVVGVPLQGRDLGGFAPRAG